tara:strand:+ start:1081 stop:1662 length:582 start_codon:yes stop_codon:yes gene_type:complete
MKKLEEKFEKAYNEYITSVSNEDMAISREACLYILRFCLENKPLKITDLGSGITSYALRLYQQYSDDDVIVFSVDDDKKWLSKSKEFCNKHNLNTDNFLYNIESLQEHKNQFDLVIHDYGNIPIRTSNTVNAFNLAKISGTVVYDDCHKESYYIYLKNTLKTLSQEIIELPETEDKLFTNSSRQRFCVKVIKK